MRSNKTLLTLVLLFSALAVFGQSAPPETDFQVWSETTFVLPLIKAKDDKGKAATAYPLSLSVR